MRADDVRFLREQGFQYDAARRTWVGPVEFSPGMERLIEGTHDGPVIRPRVSPNRAARRRAARRRRR